MPKVTSLADLELRHLAALRAVAEEGTFGRAAARLGFTQSAVSQQIGALERVVGEPVFDRPGGPRPVALTPAGRILLRHANAILDRVRQAEGDLDGLRSASRGRLAIGTFQSMSVRIVPGVLSELRKAHPHVELVLVESDDQDELLTRLRDGDLDITFVVTLNDTDLDIVPLLEDPFVLVCPRDSAILPKKGPVPAALLDELTMVSQPSNACQAAIDRGLHDLGVHPDVVFRSSDNAAVQAMVSAGMGHALMPRLALDLADPSVVFREISPPVPPRAIGLASIAGRTLAPIVDEFIEIAKRQTRMLGMPPGTTRRGAKSPAA
jgi:DNA-binding transcriptional LysR family regulator